MSKRVPQFNEKPHASEQVQPARGRGAWPSSRNPKAKDDVSPERVGPGRLPKQAGTVSYGEGIEG